MEQRLEQRRGPSVAWYWIGGALLAVGVVLGIVAFVGAFVSYADDVDDLTRVAVPGTSTAVLEGAPQTVFWEPAHGRLDTPYNVTIRIEDESGRPLTVARYGTDLTYDTPDHAGIAVFTVEPPVTGTYRVHAETASGEFGSLAFGENPVRGLFGDLAIAVGLLVAGLLVGGGIVAATAIGRHRARPKLQPLHSRPAYPAPAPAPAAPGIISPPPPPPGH